MRRDMKLCEKIMTQVERQPSLDLAPVGVEGHEVEEIDYHLMLLREAGFVDAEQVHGSKGQSQWHARRLTWAGCEWLERERATQRRNMAGSTRV